MTSSDAPGIRNEPAPARTIAPPDGPPKPILCTGMSKQWCMSGSPAAGGNICVWNPAGSKGGQCVDRRGGLMEAPPNPAEPQVDQHGKPFPGFEQVFPRIRNQMRNMAGAGRAPLGPMHSCQMDPECNRLVGPTPGGIHPDSNSHHFLGGPHLMPHSNAMEHAAALRPHQTCAAVCSSLPDNMVVDTSRSDPKGGFNQCVCKRA